GHRSGGIPPPQTLITPALFSQPPPPPAGRRGRKARTPRPGPLGAPASRRQLTLLLLAPSLPAGGGGGWERGVGGVRPPRRGTSSPPRRLRGARLQLRLNLRNILLQLPDAPALGGDAGIDFGDLAVELGPGLVGVRTGA